MIARKALRWGWFWWACDWLLVLGVIWGSLTPGPDLPHVVNRFNDKVLHAGAYFLMAFWFAGSLDRRRYWIVALALCALGGLIEILQYAMGFGRDADWYDFYADAAGVFAALAFAFLGLGNWMAWVERRLADR